MKRSAPERIADIRAAIARNNATIGEAASHVPDSATEALPEIDWSAIRGMQNVLIHEYFGVENAVVRDVIETGLHPLDNALA